MLTNLQDFVLTYNKGSVNTHGLSFLSRLSQRVNRNVLTTVGNWIIINQGTPKTSAVHKVHNLSHDHLWTGEKQIQNYKACNSSQSTMNRSKCSKSARNANLESELFPREEQKPRLLSSQRGMLRAFAEPSIGAGINLGYVPC